MNTQRQQGVALVMVLIIVAMISIISAQLISERNLQARRTSNIILADNAWHFALGAEILAKIVIKKSLEGEESVNLSQPWAMEGIVFPIEGGTIAAEFKDLRSCFNLNGILATKINSGDKKHDEQDDQENPEKGPLAGEIIFTELLKNLALADVNPKALAATLRDWIDEDQQPSGFDGREDYEYSGYTLPYRTADTFIGSRTELATISGFNSEIIERILPYVCIIPDEATLILNVNTISVDQPELLSSFYDKLDITQASSILSSRPEEGFEKSEFDTQLPADAVLRKGASIDFTSAYFAVSIKVEVQRARVNLKSLLHYHEQSDDVLVIAHLGLDD
ncbi:MAG: general secretion pathway protein K [Enterobacterales bacterium]